MKLQEIRKQIDRIDRELLVLLQERMGLALRSKKFKKTIADPAREKGPGETPGWESRLLHTLPAMRHLLQPDIRI